MLIGTAPPDWAKALVGKWIIKDVRYEQPYKVFVTYADDIGPDEGRVRIFGEVESTIRDSINGISRPGLYCEMLDPKWYELTVTPEGLEEWTAEHEKNVPWMKHD